MNLYKKYYRIIGLVILVVGMVILPFLPKLIKGTVPGDVSVYLLYLMHLFATVLSYWLFAYKNCLLTAFQRNDISSKVSLVMSTCKYIIQILVLLLFKDYYSFLLVLLLTQLSTNIVTSRVVDKMFPELQARGQLDNKEVKVINTRVKDLFTTKIGGVLLNSSDSLVISAFLGLREVALYQNYFYIETAVASFLGIIFTSIIAGIGNSLVTEDKEKNFHDFETVSFLVMWIVGLSSCCMTCIYQPFMELWVGKEYMLGFTAVIGFVLYYFSYELIQMFSTFKDAAGIWRQDRFRPLVAAGINLVLNIALVRMYGVYGVVFASVITRIVIEVPWIIRNIFKYAIQGDCKRYVMKMLKYTFVMAVSVTLSYGSCRIVHGPLIVTIVINFFICTVVSNLIYVFVYRKTQEFRRMVDLINKIVGNKMGFLYRICG